MAKKYEDTINRLERMVEESYDDIKTDIGWIKYHANEIKGIDPASRIHIGRLKRSLEYLERDEKEYRKRKRVADKFKQNNN